MSANIIFDLDGTLVDSAPSLCAAGNRLTEELGRAPVDVETYKRFVGRGIPKQVEGLLEHTGGVPGDLSAHVARFREIYDENPLVATRPYEGVAEALAALRAAGHRLGICTQKPTEPGRRVLGGLGLSPLFDGFTFGDTIAVMKPDPEMIRNTLKDMGPGPVVFVGDSETDAATAANFGCPFVIHEHGYRKRPWAEIAHAAHFATWAEAVPRILAVLAAPQAGAEPLRLG
ncbi:HAD-IA family hydrolase [Oceanicella sp. SM1341]|uniref:HAD-IA family hydrolase n=1 Tax=Oceanicella sp. SM1341 TaxID=1548889 RepID=UPI0013004923|nr:HAD-IA family hydrolase [Oceanicella sp. SM1341]